ncbi:MAG: hypothetical protein NT171_16805 [Planctomycetota bacterium]|nr:hypothetical protein [Planctomycetota bacterium]
MTYVRAAVKSTASELTQAIEKAANRKGASRHQEDRASSRAIFAFLDKLAAWTKGMHELHRRAALIENSCGKGSAYERSRQQVLPRLNREIKDEHVKRFRKRLIVTKEVPVQLFELDEVSRLIEAVIPLERNSKLRELLAEWLGACAAIQRQADGLSVDGCWLLDQHLREQQVEPQHGMGFNTALTRSVSGAWHRDQIRSAVASLIEPIDRLPSDPPATRRKGNKGRPPRPKADLQADEKLVNEWKRASESGVAKKDFTKGRGMTVQDLDRVIDRVRKQGKRSPTKS